MRWRGRERPAPPEVVVAAYTRSVDDGLPPTDDAAAPRFPGSGSRGGTPSDPRREDSLTVRRKARVVRRVRPARARGVLPVAKAARRSAVRVSPIRCKRPSALPTRVRAAMRAVVPVARRVPVASRVAAWTVAAWMACRAVAAKVKSGDFFLRAR